MQYIQSVLLLFPLLLFTAYIIWCFPGGTSGKEPTYLCRRHKRCGFNPWVRKIPWRRKWQPTSTLAWRIAWTEESGRLQFIELQRVGQDWSDLACTHACTIYIIYIMHCLYLLLFMYLLLLQQIITYNSWKQHKYIIYSYVVWSTMWILLG